MKRYFDLRDKRQTAVLMIDPQSEAASARAKEFESYFGSEDVREITLSQYRRLSVQYEDK